MIFGKWRWLYFLLTIFTHCVSHAQVPGYQGKRTGISLDANIAPAILYGISHDIWGPNFRSGINIERVLSRRFSMGLSGYYFQTRAAYFQPTSGIAGRVQNKAFATGIQIRNYRFWRRGNIAPIGPYQKLEVLYVYYQVSDSSRQFPPGGQEMLGRFHDLAITLTIGTQRILKGNFTYHYGIQTGTLLSLFNANFESSADPQHLGAARIIRNLSFTVNFGIGMLL